MDSKEKGQRKQSLLRAMQVEVLSKMADLATAAFGVIAALAWNEAIKAWMTKYVTAGEGVPALFQYALLVTVAGVIITMLVARAAAKLDAKR